MRTHKISSRAAAVAAACTAWLVAAMASAGSPSDAVTLDVDPGSGEALLVFHGPGSIAGYDIESLSGQLLPAGLVSLGSRYGAEWELLSSDPALISEGSLTATLTYDGELSLGNVFTPGGVRDLQFTWLDASGLHAYTPEVHYVPEPEALAALGSLALIGIPLSWRRRSSSGGSPRR